MAATCLGASAAFQGGVVNAQEAALEQVTVTGSRIQRSGMSTPTPVTTLNAEEMAVMAPGQMVEGMAAMPQFLGNHLPDDGGAFSTTAGQSFLNLRALGSNRMLVLLDGRRIVPASQGGAVNINLIPEAVVDRVEVVTGGASAAYGSDAVTGVTNFVLDTDFVGFNGHAQTGETSRGDRQTFEASLAGGFELGERAHVLLAVDRYHSDGVFGWDDRDWFRSYAELDNPNAPPAEITVPNARTTLYTYGGLIPSGPLARTQFLPDGTPAPFQAGDIVDPPFAQSGGDGVNPLVDNEMYPETERTGGFVYLDYDLSDDTTAYFQGIYGESTVQYRVSELRMYSPFGTQGTIFRDNAYLPDSIGTAMDDAGIQSFSFHRMSSFADWSDVEYTRNTTRSFTVGLDSDIGDWALNAYFQYGKNKRLLDGLQPRMDHVYQALDAVEDPMTGEIVCNSTLTNPNDGCVPLNLFGHGQMSPEAVDYILDNKVGFMFTRQRFGEVSASRDLFSGRDAGPVAIAAGVSYREESMDADVLPPGLAGMPTLAEVDYRGLPPGQAGSPFIFQQANMLVVSGGYDVKELFAETILPVVADTGFAESLNLNLAARYAEYSGSGSIQAWKAGIDWQITPAVRFRATRSRDIRAANLAERFDRQRTDGSIDDPWTGTEHTPVERTISGGNPNVSPEKGNTLTAGFVFQPDAISGLSMSIDWYDTEIIDAIDQVGGQDIVDMCFEEGSFCNLLKQDPVTNEVLRIDNIFINLVEAGVRGTDFELTYNRPIGQGDLTFRFFAAHLAEHSFTDQFGNKIDSAGETGDSSLPEWQGIVNMTYNRGPLRLGVSQRYIGSGVRDLTEVEGVDIDDNTVDAVHYTNLRFSYDLERPNGVLEFFANVENLFDKDPPLAPGGFSFFSGADHTNANLFDRLGRSYTLGLRYQL